MASYADPVEDAKRALDLMPEYVPGMLSAFERRTALRKQMGLPVLLVCGHGGAGKDFAAQYLCTRTSLIYSGSTSTTVAPLIAAATKQDEASAILDRRNQREYWYKFCNEVRRKDATILAKMNLAWGDIVVGLRDDFEFWSCSETGVFDVSVWIDNPRVPEDPTVKFGPEDCDITLHNVGSRCDFYRKLDTLLGILSTPYFNPLKP